MKGSHNLPAQTTRFIGRETEIAAVRALLQRPDLRLLTLTGSGGTGKTRLALQVAARVGDDFADGVFFVPLSSIADVDLVASTIARALDLKEAGGQPIFETLKNHLRDRQILLLLDNFEQLLPARHVVSELLAACRRLKILVTSRGGLHLYGEHIFVVPPMSMPPGPAFFPPEVGARLDPIEDLVRYEAVQLFLDRAGALAPDFALTRRNAPAVAEICRRLDGLPLAIELAAARIRILSPEEMLPRLEDALGLLTGGALDLPARLQTLRDTFEWSYDLLDRDEQALLRRLGVFVGGCTLDAIEAVCTEPRAGDERRDAGDAFREAREDHASRLTHPAPGVGAHSALSAPYSVLDLVGFLLDKSLLMEEQLAHGRRRFWMLNTLREYALEKLLAHGETALVRRRHALYYLSFVEEAALKLRGPEETLWLDQLERDQGNTRAALLWFVENQAAEEALRMIGASVRFWHLHGYFTEGRRRAAEVLALPAAAERTAGRARALIVSGRLARLQGDVELAARYIEEGLAIGRELQDRHVLGTALNDLGSVAFSNADYTAAHALYEESLAIRRQHGSRLSLLPPLNNLALIANDQGDYATAVKLLHECLDIATELEEQHACAALLHNLGDAAGRSGDLDTARAYYEQSLARWGDLGDRFSTANTRSELGVILRHQGGYAAARTLYEESLSIRHMIGDRAGIAWSLLNLGELALIEGDTAGAGRLFKESLSLMERVGERLGTAACLVGLGRLAVALAKPTRAARLFGAAESILAAAGAVMPLIHSRDYGQALEAVSALLGADRLASLRAAARAMSPAELSSYAREEHDEALETVSTPARSEPAPHPGGLSEREVEVLRLVAANLSNAQVADKLAVSPYTVNAHLRTIYRKLGVATRAEATRFAIAHNLVP